MKVKLKDIKQGKTFWKAEVIYDAEGKLHASAHRIFIKGRPFKSKHTRSAFVKYESTHSGEVWVSERSLLDDNVIPNTYNMHALFTTKKSADRYIQRLANGCLSASEIYMRAKLIQRRQDEFDEEDWGAGLMEDYWNSEKDFDNDDFADDETYALPS